MIAVSQENIDRERSSFFSSELRAASKRKIMLINGKKRGEIFSFLGASPLAPHARSRSTVIQRETALSLRKTKLERVPQ